MPRVIIVGGGWAGCAAALSARQAGAEVVLLERADSLLGAGQVGGIMRNNGRFTAAEEMIALGGGDLFKLSDDCARHANMEFPGHKHASLYDVSLMEPVVRRHLQEKQVETWTVARATNVEVSERKIKFVELEGGQRFEGDVFVDTTGTMGPQGNCRKYGNGCAMCITRCPTFGGRVSIAGRAGVQESKAKRIDGSYGSMSGSCKLNKDSLDKGIVSELERTGVVVIPLPKDVAKKKEKLLAIKSCQQYALADFAENVVLLDTGHAKLMSPFYPLEELRRIPGLENARFEDPYAGGMGNSIRFLAMSPRDNHLKVEGVDNLFCGGEKAGMLVGITEAIATGTLAGHNAVRHALGKELTELPRSLCVGDMIAYVKEEMETKEGMFKKFTFSGSVYFDRMKEVGLYTTEVKEIEARVADSGLTDIFGQSLT
jgi:hypothetical protein